MIRHSTIKDSIYKSIFNDVLDGLYSTSYILTEKMMIEKYGRSKSPVREALTELSAGGILKSIPRKGYQVVPILPREIKEALELRKLIEIYCFDLVSQNFSTTQIEQLKKQRESALEIVKKRNIADFWLSNIEFHVLLASFAQNQYLCKELREVMLFCSRGVGQYYQESWEEKQGNYKNHHDLLIEALEKKDLKAAKEILLLDIDSIFKSILN